MQHTLHTIRRDDLYRYRDEDTNVALTPQGDTYCSLAYKKNSYEKKKLHVHVFNLLHETAWKS